MRAAIASGAVAVWLTLVPALRAADAPDATPSPSPTPSNLHDTLEAGDGEDERPARRLVKWNEYEGKFFTIRLGAGLLYEAADYIQDDDSKEQFDLHPQGKVRDARFSLRGRLKITPKRDI